MISPKFEELSKKHPELKFVIIDADKELELTESERCGGIPKFCWVPQCSKSNVKIRCQ